MKKTFDCVDMKRNGQDALLKRLEGLAVEQQNAYWAQRSRQMRDDVDRAIARLKKARLTGATAIPRP